MRVGFHNLYLLFMATTIFGFLSDKFQQQIKHVADTGDNRFEDVMKQYKTLFFDDLAALQPIATCADLNPKIQSFPPQQKQTLHNWLTCLEQTIVGSTPAFQEFFDELINVYESYIRGNVSESSMMLKDILTHHQLFDFVQEFDKYYPITFRGRINNGGAIVPTAEYFYHLPFDKINLVKNYRFSINGQPFIYLGASLPTVILELRSDINVFNNVELSSWGVKPNQNLTMYDISNSLFDLINLNIIPIVEDGIPINCTTNDVTPNQGTFVTEFKKFIVSQFCTFEKRAIGNQTFIEQYVIPQLLTEQIRNCQAIHYDGIIFPSTQYLNRVSENGTSTHYGLFKNNIALFTRYSPADEYDSEVIDKFHVTPINKVSQINATTFLQQFDTEIHRNNANPVMKVNLKLLVDYYDQMQLDNVTLPNLTLVQIQFASMIDYMKKI